MALFAVCNRLISRLLQYALQKTAFCVVKDGKLQPERWPFAGRKATFCMAWVSQSRSVVFGLIVALILSVLPFGLNCRSAGSSFVPCVGRNHVKTII